MTNLPPGSPPGGRFVFGRRKFLGLAGAIPSLGAVAGTRIVFGGDAMLCRYIGEVARRKKDPAWAVREIAPFLSGADIAFANLESPFSDKGKPVNQGMVFKAEPDMVAALKVAGISIVSTANNHARDRGAYGVEFTLKCLADNGIATVGSAATAALAHAGTVLVRNGARFGFLAYAQDQTNGNWPDIDERICAMDIAAMRRDVASMGGRADVVIVSMHGGVEYWSKVHLIQQRFARAAVEAGATLVVGHHPHVVQRSEVYGAGVIFYSLGNFIFDQFARQETRRGLLAEAIFNGVELVRVNAIPLDLTGGIPRISGDSARIK
jgi:poly-gamma-glutamate capsule biosynthesis protein CapA/YwtB (metallophosphatase superfamily)